MSGAFANTALRSGLPPGVYERVVEAPPQVALRLDTTAFLGLCAKGRLHEPVLVESWSAFVANFGAPGDGRLLPQAVHQYFVHGGRRAVIVRAPESPLSRAGILAGLDQLSVYDDKNETAPIALICAPDLLHPDVAEPVEEPPDQPQVRDDLRFAESCLPMEAEQFRTVLPLWGELGEPTHINTLIDAMVQLKDAAERGPRIVLIDLPPRLGSAEIEDIRGRLMSERVALYAPWLLAAPAEDPGGDWRPFPPCGAVAGLIARSERRRGIWVAPANLGIQGIGSLYRDPYLPAPGELHKMRVNLIRATPQGPTLLGAQTTSDDREWRHIGTRRLLDWLCGQLALDVRWAVFEPSDRRLWRKLELTVTRRMSALYQAGALAGANPHEAWFVRCDTSTNPLASRDAGRVVVQVGLAPAVPAEFLVFRLNLLSDGGVSVEAVDA